MNLVYQTKSEMVYDGIRKDILNGIILPGDRLLISAVAKRYGISEIPVREAFQILTQEGFLNSKPNSGFVVSQISKKDVNNIFHVRVELESLAVREAVRYITDEDIDKLEKMIDASEKYIETCDYGAYWLSNREWHFAVYSYSKNDVLIRLLTEMYNYSCRYPAYYTHPQELCDSVASHRGILDAMRCRDAEMADALIRSHTIKTRYHYINRLQEALGDDLLE